MTVEVITQVYGSPTTRGATPLDFITKVGRLARSVALVVVPGIGGVFLSVPVILPLVAVVIMMPAVLALVGPAAVVIVTSPVVVVVIPPPMQLVAITSRRTALNSDLTLGVSLRWRHSFIFGALPRDRLRR
jgi:hypothetical protein